MKQIWNDLKTRTVFWTCLVVTILLFVGSALTPWPPTFDIGPSIFQAAGFLFSYATLAIVAQSIEKGLDIRMKHQHVEISVSSKQDEETEERDDREEREEGEFPDEREEKENGEYDDEQEHHHGPHREKMEKG